MTDLERYLQTQMRQLSLPEPVHEWPFHPVRKWKFDFAWPELMLALEVEGGTFRGGRHTRGMGYHNDLEKYNEATRLGWKVYRFDSMMVNDGSAAFFVEKILRELVQA